MCCLADSPLSTSAVPTLPSAPKPGFWQRRVRDPLLALLTQGATPEKLASAIAWGFVCSLFPFLGFTTGLNALVGLWRKLNQPLLQALNYALSPLHLAMILVYVRIGEWLWRAEDRHFTLRGMIASFHELSFGAFLREFGWVGAHAFTGWLVTAPALFVVVYFPARAGLRRLSYLLPERGRE
jgi:hypothetical protein